jgi:group I intron endonuclease
MSTGYIYRITNTVTGHCYIGMTTKNIQLRLERHLYNAATGQTHLYRAMRKYGYEKFKIELLEEVALPINHLNKILGEREEYWVAQLNPHYNMTSGGEGVRGRIGWQHSEETRQKIGNSHRGMKRSLEARQRMSEAQKRISTPEHRAKISARKLGKKDSPEVRENKRKAQLARWVKIREKKEAGRTPAPGGYASHNA